MKKLSLLLLAAVFSLSIYSCRETTEEKTEDAMESAADDMEDAADEAGNEIEAAGENAETELEEEVNGTDDVNADDDM
tara:strand:- start:175 stop:408 length:234 start_codon:yes stop_codon:yes gene_type:complete